MTELFRDKKKIILGILIFIFAVSLVYRATHPYRQRKVDTLTYTGAKSEARDKKGGIKDTDGSTVEEPLVMLDMFFDPPGHAREQTRNIFSREGETDEALGLPNQYEVDQKIVDDAPPVDEENSVEDDLSGFRTFGYMEGGGERILFLEKGEQITLIRKGDRIEGKYIVEDITKDELSLKVISSNEKIHIDLSDL